MKVKKITKINVFSYLMLIIFFYPHSIFVTTTTESGAKKSKGKFVVTKKKTKKTYCQNFTSTLHPLVFEPDLKIRERRDKKNPLLDVIVATREIF